MLLLLDLSCTSLADAIDYNPVTLPVLCLLVGYLSPVFAVWEGGLILEFYSFEFYVLLIVLFFPTLSTTTSLALLNPKDVVLILVLMRVLLGLASTVVVADLVVGLFVDGCLRPDG